MMVLDVYHVWHPISGWLPKNNVYHVQPTHIIIVHRIYAYHAHPILYSILIDIHANHRLLHPSIVPILHHSGMVVDVYRAIYHNIGIILTIDANHVHLVPIMILVLKNV